MIAYIAKVKPYAQPLNNFQEFFNEILALIAAYPLLAFTSLEYSLKERIDIAWILLSCLAVLILFNIVVYFYAMVKWIQQKCRIYHSRKKAHQLRLAAQVTAANSKPKAESQSSGKQDDKQARANYI